MNVFDELKARGMVAQMTNEEKIRELLGGEPISFYIGFEWVCNTFFGQFYSFSATIFVYFA